MASRVTPNTRVMLRKQLPMMFARAMWMLLFFVAWMLVASSGRLVPSAIIVDPITIFGMPMFNAIKVAASTIK